jgi:signal transduction histidine kinase
VSGLLNLSRPAAMDASETTTCDWNAIVTDVVTLLEHQFDMQRVKVRRELSGEPVLVTGVEQKLQQVLLNLFLNAKDAMPRGGWLSLSTAIEGNEAIVEVADTGTGIPADALDRIYDPFFTTKPIGRGTGLGLSIAYGIVREHDGSIECVSHVGQGTRFTIRMPRAAVLPLARTSS